MTRQEETTDFGYPTDTMQRTEVRPGRRPNQYAGADLTRREPDRGWGSPRGRVPAPLSEDLRFRAARVGFEALLIALCAYLIGVAGLPPLFDAPGSGDAQPVGSSVVAEQTAEQAGAEDGAADGGDTVGAEASNPLPGAGVPVSVGRATWSTGYFQAALFKAMLGELGYEVGEPSTNELGPSEMYRVMAEGNVQFWTNSWMPNHFSFLDEDFGDGTLVGDQLSQVGNLLPAGGLEGLVLTKSLADEFNITSLQQINDDPALVELFDVNGNGLADISGCAADWGCNTIINEMITFNGWDNLEQIAPDDYDVAIEELIARVDAGEPAMLYTWSPSGYLTRLRPGDNVLWVDMGGQENLLDGSITPEYDFDELAPAPLGPACTNEPCYLGWAAADIKVTARNDFLDANPSARVLFEVAELKVLDVALANVKFDSGENAETDLDRHAQEWIAENRALVDSWLDAARAAS